MISGCHIVVAQPQDAESLIGLFKKLKQEVDAFTMDPTLGQLTVKEQAREIMLVNQTRSFLIVLAKVHNQLVGVLTIQELDDSGIGELGISVLKAYQHQGIGTQLMKMAIHWGLNDSNLSNFALLVKTNNRKAISLYEKCGFSLASHRIINATGSVNSTYEMQLELKK